MFRYGKVTDVVDYINHIKIYFVIILLFLVNQILTASTTGTLSGRVYDKKDGSVLFGVNVIIVETRQGAATDSDGRFKIHNIRAGVYTVRISMMGYRRVEYSKIKIIQDHITKLDVYLEMSVVPGRSISITSKRPVIQTDVTGSENYFQGDLLLEIPVSGINDVIGLQPSSTIEGNVRGGKLREVAFIIDGFAAADYISGKNEIQIPLSAVEHINVVTGGFSPEYGNALSGVVNVVTKNGGDSFKVLSRFEGDDFFGGTENSRRKQAEITVSGPIKKEKIHFISSNNLTLSGTRWWQDFQYFFKLPVDKYFYGFSKINFSFSPAKKLVFQTIYSKHSWRDYEFSWRYNLAGLPEKNKSSVRSAVIWNHNILKNCYYSIHVSHSYITENIGKGNPDSLTQDPFQYDFFMQYIVSGRKMWRATMIQQVVSLKSDITLNYGRFHMFQAGVELNQFDIFSDVRKLEPQLTYFGKPMIFEPLLNYSSVYNYYPRSGSAYVMDKIEAGKEGSVINIGLRFSFLDPRAERPAVELVPDEKGEYKENITGYVKSSVKWAVSPRFGYSFPLNDKTFFFVNYGHYVQYPLFDYLYSGLHNVQIEKGVNVLRGNPDLLAEKTKSWELSIRHKLSDNTAVMLTYFNKETKNQIDTKTFVPSNSRIAGDYGFAEYVNNPYAVAKGFELQIKRTEGKFIRGTVSYSWMEAKGLSEYENQQLNYSQWGFPLAKLPFYLSWDQRHTFTANLDVDLPVGVHASIIYRFHTGRPYTYFPSLDGFTPENPEMQFLPNNRRMPSNQFLNFKIYRNFVVKGIMNRNCLLKIKTYVDARNVLDKPNVRWIDSCGRIGGELGDPSAFYTGRRVNAGVEIKL